MSSTVAGSMRFKGSEKEQRLRGTRRGLLGLSISLLWVAAFGVLTARQWQNLRRGERFLDESLISKSVADYSAKPPAVPIGRVRLTVIEDMVRDSQPEAADLQSRLATIPAILNSDIPGDKTPLPPKGSEAGRTILYFDDPVQVKAVAIPRQAKAVDVPGSPTAVPVSGPGIAPAPIPVPAETLQPPVPDTTKPLKKARLDHPGKARPDHPGQMKNAPANKGQASGSGGSKGQKSGNSKGWK
jgi:hypothetical protein